VRRDERGRCIGIDQELADLDWAINTDPAEALKNGKNPAALLPRDGGIADLPECCDIAASAGQAERVGAPGRGDDPGRADGAGRADVPEREGEMLGTPPAETVARGPGKDDPFGYQQARARREEIERALKQLDLLERRGALVRASEVEKAAAETARQVRNAMLAIPDRLAPVLDPANPGRAHKLLTDEIGKALRELSAALDESARRAERDARNASHDERAAIDRAAAPAGADERELALL
jgi:hypothetical protein